MTEKPKRKRQFTFKKGQPKFYDRKVRKQGDTLVISLGKIVPDDWIYVRLRVFDKTDTTISLLIEKLLGAEIDAPIATAHSRRKQDA